MNAGLIETFEALNISQDALPFAPAGDKSWILDTLRQVPPYLFRVYSSRSAGFNNEEWAKSRDAKYSAGDCSVDIFSRNNEVAADMVNIHLRWWGRNGQSINLVSWTSSLLFALQYIFYLHRSARDGSSLDDIKLCVIDTRLFRDGCFIRDMDLIRAYEDVSVAANGLTGLARLRNKEHNSYAGSYYFGEYLSQGALRIQDKCSIVPASAIIHCGLFTLQPLLQDYEQWPAEKTPWANEVIRLREDFYSLEAIDNRVTDAETDAAADIASLFRPHFRLPIASSLLSLLRRWPGDAQIRRFFRSSLFSESVRVDCAWFSTMPIYESLPEVTQFRDTIRAIYEDYCKQEVDKLSDKVSRMELDLRSVTAEMQSAHFGQGLEFGFDMRPKLRSHFTNISLLAKVLERDVRYATNSQL